MATDNTLAILQGKVFLATRVANGAVNGGYLFVGEVEGLTLKQNQKFEEIHDNTTGLGLQIGHAPTETSLMLEGKAIQFDTANIARLSYGTYGGAVSGGTVSSEAITAYNGQMAVLANPGVSSVVVTKAPSTTLVAGTDYTVDPVFGTLQFLASSTAVPAGPGVPCTVNYTYAAYTGKVEAFTQPIAEYALRLQGINTMNGNSAVIFNAHRVSLDLLKSLELISKKHMTLDLSGALLPDYTKPAGQSAFYNLIKA